MIKLTGSELGWILRLAEQHNNDLKSKGYFKKHKLDGLDDYLELLLLRFHPNNFNAGNSKQVWFLVNKTELEEHLEKLYEAWRKQPYLLSSHTKAIEEMREFFDIEGKKT